MVQADRHNNFEIIRLFNEEGISVPENYLKMSNKGIHFGINTNEDKQAACGFLLINIQRLGVEVQNCKNEELIQKYDSLYTQLNNLLTMYLEIQQNDYQHNKSVDRLNKKSYYDIIINFEIDMYCSVKKALQLIEQKKECSR